MSTTRSEPLTVAARPLRADAARNREKVLASAQELFARHGREVQMEDLARHAGVGIGTLYRHFPTKAALVEALSARRWAEVGEHMERECLPVADTFAGVERMLRHAGEIQARDRCFCDAVEEVTGVAGPSGPGFDEVDALLEQLLERGRAAGVLRDDITRERMHGVFCGLAAVVRSGQDWRPYVEIVLDGLRAR